MVFAGIDYSLTSPSITIYNNDQGFEWKNCQTYFLSDIKKTHGIHENIVGTPMPLYTSDQERYHEIASWAFDIVYKHSVDLAFIEDYSYGSTGRVFHIAENAGVLKQQMWESGVTFETIPPTVIKKHATGKGNASKAMMEEAFTKETLVDLRCILNLTEKQNNPISDIIDSYYIMKTGYCSWLCPAQDTTQ